jgi:hypothetical protein
LEPKKEAPQAGNPRGSRKGEIVQSSSYRKRPPKANLKLVVAGAEVNTKIRLAGRAPSDEMAPGTYLVTCESAWIESIGKGSRAVFQFRVVDGKYGDVALRLWDGGGYVSPGSRYARYCALALARPLDRNDDLSDPAQIFSGQNFLALVGYRKTDRQRGGQASEENTRRRKDDADFLRVHDLLSRAGV